MDSEQQTITDLEMIFNLTRGKDLSLNLEIERMEGGVFQK